MTSSGDGVESFSNLLRGSSASRSDQSLAHQRDNGVGVHPRRDRPHTSKTATSHRGSSHRRSHSTAWDPFLRPVAAGTTSSSLRVGAHLGGDVQQLRTTNTMLSVSGAGRSLTANHLRPRESLPQVNPHRLPSRFFGEEYGHSTGVF